MKEKIHIFYTNDLHSYFEHWPQVVTYLEEKRQYCKRRDETSWTVDIGDHIDRVHPITEASMGKANVELLNDADYDVVTIGNNEGITLSHEQLFYLYQDAKFAIVCSNLYSMRNTHPRWLHRSKILTSKHGVRVGFIGLTAPFNPYYNLLDWNIEFPLETVEKQLKQLNSKVDILVLLSHLGIYEDEAIANEFPEIDVIIGGHTHHLLRTGERVNNSLLTAAGKHCAYVGEVTLTWDHRTKQITNKEAHATNITHLYPNIATRKRLKELEEAAAVILDKKIIHVKEPIKVDWFKETKIMKLLTKKLRERTKADCAMLNAGILMDHFPTGNITYRDVHRICPHPINPCVVTLTGDELQEVVRVSLTENFMNFQLKGFGFRGKVIGRMVFDNLEVRTAYHENGQEYVREILFQGEPLEAKREYTVVTADTFTFGRLLPEVAKSEQKKLFLPEFIREILVDTLLEYQEDDD